MHRKWIYEEDTDTEVGSLLQQMLNEQRKFALIAGDHGVGKSSLGGFFAFSWYYKNNTIEGMDKFDVVALQCVSEHSVLSVNNILELSFPLSSSILNEKLNHNSVTSTTLVILDDCNYLSSKAISKLLKLMKDSPPGFYFILLTTLTTGKEFYEADELEYDKNFLSLRLKG